MRVLWIDATRGFAPQALIAALADLGVPPSPILHAVGGLGVPIEMRIEPGRVGLLPPMAGILVKPHDVLTLLDRAAMPGPARVLAADAIGRLFLAEAMAARVPSLDIEVDAGVIVALVGAAVAMEGLHADRILVSRIGVADEPSGGVVELLGDWADALDHGVAHTGSEGAAFLRSFCHRADVAQPEPAWHGHVARGAAEGPVPVCVALGNLSGNASNL